MKEASDLEKRMTQRLKQYDLGHWKVHWLPDPAYPIRGRANPEKKLIEIFDENEDEAWGSFIHELLEIKLRSALRPYRILVNKLIEGFQEIADTEKDVFIESIIENFASEHQKGGGSK